MEQLGKREDGKVVEACPVCGMVKTDWPGEGVMLNGTQYCCRGCAEGKECTCPQPAHRETDAKVDRDG